MQLTPPPPARCPGRGGHKEEGAIRSRKEGPVVNHVLVPDEVMDVTRTSFPSGRGRWGLGLLLGEGAKRISLTHARAHTHTRVGVGKRKRRLLVPKIGCLCNIAAAVYL